MNEGSIETEVKFRAINLAALRADLISKGAIVSEQRHLERNILFDDAEGSLKRRGMLLRLRSALDANITLKAPAPPEAQSTQHKSRIEYEIVVSDAETAFKILTALGYSPSWRYEKYRESFRLDDVTIVLDHTPIGDFAEIEGAPSALRPIADRLGFNWDDRNLLTYRELFDAAGLTDRTDMVFQPDV
jgi:adenylate cyclase class 2